MGRTSAGPLAGHRKRLQISHKRGMTVYGQFSRSGSPGSMNMSGGPDGAFPFAESSQRPIFYHTRDCGLNTICRYELPGNTPSVAPSVTGITGTETDSGRFGSFLSS